MKMYKKILATVSGAALVSASTLNHAYAATKDFCSEKSATFLDLPTWYKYLKPEFTNGNCELHMKFPEDISKVGLAIVEILLRLGGLVAVGFVIYGGFKYITSQGEPEKTKNGRQTIINAIIGLMITIIATIAVSFIGSEFIK